jgi:hypothetical protein
MVERVGIKLKTLTKNMKRNGKGGKYKLGEEHEEEGNGREVNQEKNMKRKAMVET